MNLDLIYSRPAKTAAQLATQARRSSPVSRQEGAADRRTRDSQNLQWTGVLPQRLRAAHPHLPEHHDSHPRRLRRPAGAVSEAFVKRIAFGPGVEHCDHVDDLGLFDAILSVGTAVKPGLPWTTINSNGWLARVSSGTRGLPADVAMENPVGALAAASLGVGEVFKRLIKLKPERGEMLDGFSFSLRSYRAGETDCGPALAIFSGR